MMTFHGVVSYFLLATLVVLSQTVKCTDSFDQAKCDSLTGGKASDHNTPRFHRDFKLLSETAELNTENTETVLTVYHEKLWYSDTFGQVLKYKETPQTSTWLLVDQYLQNCLFKEPSGQCEDNADTCSTRASEFFDANKYVNIGNHITALQYPRPNRAEVSLGTSSVRGIDSNKIATCAYDEPTQTTTVSEWHILDSVKFNAMDNSFANLLMARHKKFKSGAEISDVRVDYANYQQLSTIEIPNGLQIGESLCGAIDGNFQGKKLPPTPSVRHGFISEFDEAAAGQVKSTMQLYSYSEYNYNSQIFFQVRTLPVPGENEKETIINVIDFSTNHEFSYSLTNGDCTPTPFATLNGYKTMPLPNQYWDLTTTPSYLGVYKNRDIPCDTWLYEFPHGVPGLPLPDLKITLFLATPNWLQSQNFPRDMFYPVQKITRTSKGNEFESFYEFKDNPGYHIPELLTCFDQDDIITGKVTLEKTNYYQSIAHHEIQFQYEFRTFIQKITGIKSHLRVAKIAAFPSTKRPDETDVTFAVLGKFINMNSSTVDAADPVTSKQATDKINKAVDQGDANFRLGATSVTLHLKKGSFSVLKNYDHFENVDNPDEGQATSGSSGYSSVVMAASGITLLIVCLGLGVLAVIIYKRWSEGQDILPSFGMQTLSNEK